MKKIQVIGGHRSHDEKEVQAWAEAMGLSDGMTVVCWPESQEIMEAAGIENLINDEEGLRLFGPSAYLVEDGEGGDDADSVDHFTVDYDDAENMAVHAALDMVFEKREGVFGGDYALYHVLVQEEAFDEIRKKIDEGALVLRKDRIGVPLEKIAEEVDLYVDRMMDEFRAYGIKEAA